MSLVRPVQSHGRIIRFSGNGYGGSARLHGHTYCTKLDTTLVRDILPLQTKDAPLRVAVLSPYTKLPIQNSKLLQLKQSTWWNQKKMPNCSYFGSG